MAYLREGGGEAARLVATKLPPGKKLLETSGMSRDPVRLAAFTRAHPQAPAHFDMVSGESVGLEWHFRTGVSSGSKEWRKDCFVVLVDENFTHGAATDGQK